MASFFRPTRRIRLRWVLLLVLSLLFQQFAVASYVCPVADMPMTNGGMAAHCDDMSMAGGQAPAKANPALCVAHCTSHALVAQDTHAPTVPHLSMPAPIPASMVLATLPAAPVVHEHAAARRLSGIPPALRFRVLLI